MLKIINNLKLFFEDCYRRVNVREYARLMNLSPPTASKLLFELNKEGLLQIEKDRNYIFFYANKENSLFRELSRIYWMGELKELTGFLNKNIIVNSIVLFGSLAKAEAKKDSDIDICIFGHKKEINLKSFEAALKRRIQLFFFNSIGDIKNKELANNIINGYVLDGRLKL